MIADVLEALRQALMEAGMAYAVGRAAEQYARTLDAARRVADVAGMAGAERRAYLAHMDALTRTQVLADEDRKRRQTAQARELANEASKIAQLLNADFQALRQRLNNIRATAAQPGTAGTSIETGTKGRESEQWTRGTDEPGTFDGTERERTDGRGQGRTEQPNPPMRPRGTPDPEGLDPLSRTGERGSQPMKGRGGFTVDYQHLGAETERSKSDRERMIIYINLDHPLVADALENGKGSVEDPVFKRISYEIAFTEYAVALGYDMADEDPGMGADDLLYEVRQSINRLSRASAEIFR